MIKEIVTDPIFLSQKSESATKKYQRTIKDNAEHCVCTVENTVGTNF